MSVIFSLSVAERSQDFGFAACARNDSLRQHDLVQVQRVLLSPTFRWTPLSRLPVAQIAAAVTRLLHSWLPTKAETGTLNKIAD